MCLRLAHVAHGFPTTGRPQAHTQFSVCGQRATHGMCFALCNPQLSKAADVEPFSSSCRISYIHEVVHTVRKKRAVPSCCPGQGRRPRTPIHEFVHTVRKARAVVFGVVPLSLTSSGKQLVDSDNLRTGATCGSASCGSTRSSCTPGRSRGIPPG